MKATAFKSGKRMADIYIAGDTVQNSPPHPFMLTDSEREQLRQNKKEITDYGLKAFSENPPI